MMKSWETLELDRQPLEGMIRAAIALGRADAFARARGEMFRGRSNAAAYRDELKMRCAEGLAGYTAWLYACTDFPNCGRMSGAVGRSTAALIRALSDCARNGDDDENAIWASKAGRIMECYQAYGDYLEAMYLIDHIEELDSRAEETEDEEKLQVPA